MLRTLWPVGLLVALVGCSESIEGQLVDGMTSKPIPDTKVIAAATDTVRLTCQKLADTTDAQGNFTIEGACLSDSAYELTTDNDNLWLGDVDTVPQGGVEGTLTVKAWRAPEGSGVYILSGEELTALRTVADLKTEKIYQTEDEKVQYPSEIPNNVPELGSGDYLVLASKEFCDKIEFIPLIESGPRKFGDDEEWVDMEAFWYLGTRFESDTEYERVEANVDKGKIIRQEGDDHAACFVPASAIPAARYVLKRPEVDRVFMIDVAG